MWNFVWNWPLFLQIAWISIKGFSRHLYAIFFKSIILVVSNKTQKWGIWDLFESHIFVVLKNLAMHTNFSSWTVVMKDSLRHIIWWITYNHVSNLVFTPCKSPIVFQSLSALTIAKLIEHGYHDWHHYHNYCVPYKFLKASLIFKSKQDISLYCSHFLQVTQNSDNICSPPWRHIACRNYT